MTRRMLRFGGAIGLLALMGLAADELPDAARSGGATTVAVSNAHAFGRPAANLPAGQLRRFAHGNSLFNATWLIAPASVQSLDGLGPLFNRASCAGCHTRDGRGRAPAGPEEPMSSMLVRLGVPRARGADPDPLYGTQVQDRAIAGARAEGRVAVSWTTWSARFPDGERYEMRRPRYAVRDLGYGPLDPHTALSPRVAPAVFGLGLLEAVPAADIVAWSDPDDANRDGISGRVQRVGGALGRFGWKAGAPTLRVQAAAAASGDMGLTSRLFPRDPLTAAQAREVALPSGGEPELADDQLDAIELYLRALAVPARRRLDDPAVVQGERLFSELGCAGCHRPVFTTGAHPEPHVADQRIAPFTDLLLHDMGPELADGLPEHEAAPSEWRTPPLWGLGLQRVVSGHQELLHDGRARTVQEAILWHGGEARGARERFRALDRARRAALLAFLASL